jgi:hypothetical protein
MDFVVKKQNHVLEKQKMMQVSRPVRLCLVSGSVGFAWRRGR